MVYMNERYYLICVPDHAPNTRLYRIDRMKDIQILDDPRSEAVARQEAQNAVYAYVGAPERIIMYCDRAILDDVIDRFGTEVQIREHDENTFTASFTAPPRGVKFWALQYLPYVEVVEPAWLRQKIIESLERTSIPNRHNLSDIVLLKACVLGGYDTDKMVDGLDADLSRDIKILATPIV